MGGACSSYGGEERNVYRVLVGKPERKRPHGRPRSRWEDNIKMDLQEVGCGGMRRISVLAANRLASQEGLCPMEYGVSKNIKLWKETTNRSDELTWRLQEVNGV